MHYARGRFENEPSFDRLSCGVNGVMADLASPDKSSVDRVIPWLLCCEMKLEA